MDNIWEKAISILAGNLNLGHIYLITTVRKITQAYDPEDPYFWKKIEMSQMKILIRFYGDVQSGGQGSHIKLQFNEG
jgi:hypothetical protein